MKTAGRQPRARQRLSLREAEVKGPGLRNELEIRRTFQCPKCGRTVLKLGDIVSVTCFCSDPPVWMQIQPDPQKRTFKFDKIEIPLSEADLVIRERPRRMPPPPPEGAPENANDRRTARPKRPKPERRSFESFQEELAAKVQAESGAHEPAPHESVPRDEAVRGAEATAEAVTNEQVRGESPTSTPAEETKPPVRQSEPDAPADEFGEGL